MLTRGKSCRPNEVKSTWFSRVNNSLCLPPYHLTFVLSYRRSTLVWHKLVNKQRLINETNINKHLPHKKPLVPYSESDRPVVCTTQSSCVAMWPAYFAHLYIDYQLANISSIGTGIVKAREMQVSSNKRTGNHTLYIYIYIYIIIIIL